MAFTFATAPGELTRRALIRARRRPGSRSPLGGTFHQLAVATGFRVRFGAEPAFPTACWTFDNVNRRHHIKLGDAFASSINVAPPRSSSPANMDRHAADFADALLRHEAAHGRFTDRDLGAMADKCRRLGVPFMLFNLFEDARIEALDRIRTGGEKFDWTRWMAIPSTANGPVAAFASCINDETVAGLRLFPMSKADSVAVREFYLDACAAPSSSAVIDVCRRWLDHWKGTALEAGSKVAPAGVPRVGSRIGSANDGSAPGETSNEPATGSGGTGPAAPPTTAAQPSTKPTTARDNGTLGEGRAGAITPSSRLEPWTYFAPGSYGRMTPDAAEADRLAMRLGRIVAASASPTTARVSSSGSRLHMAGVATGAAESFRSHGRTGGKPRLVVVMDFSSSMSGHFKAHGFPFLLAVARLVRRGVIDAKVYGTGNGACALLPNDDKSLSYLNCACGCESVAMTLETIRADVEAAHATVIYTDAQLTDGSVDSARWRARGAEVVGACVVPESSPNAVHIRANMRRHFGYHVIAPNGEQLATKLAGLLGERASRSR